VKTRPNAFIPANRHLQKSATATYRKALRTAALEPRPCIVCGKKGEGHHEDYAKPLEVVWLCRFHHMGRHKYGETWDVLPAVDPSVDSDEVREQRRAHLAACGVVDA
jgi:hypothetical protein